MLSANVPIQKRRNVSPASKRIKSPAVHYANGMRPALNCPVGREIPVKPNNARGPRPSWCSAYTVLPLAGRGDDPSSGFLLIAALQ